MLPNNYQNLTTFQVQNTEILGVEFSVTTTDTIATSEIKQNTTARKNVSFVGKNEKKQST